MSRHNSIAAKAGYGYTPFKPCWYWHFDIKPQFLPVRFAPHITRFLSQERLAACRDFEPLEQS